MKRTLVIVAVLLLALVVWLSLFPVGQHADRSFDARVARPAHTARHPVVLFDEAHYNVHTLGGNFRPFGELLRSDGYDVRAGRQRFSSASLAGIDVLAVVNAAGGSNPKLFGFNLVPLRKGRREAPAFEAAEVVALREWVANGGSLLLVADHYPFGSAAAGLAAAFGVTMHGGYAEVPSQNSTERIIYSRDNALLANTPIADGRDASERVRSVASFTGQSLDAANGVALLTLPADAVEYVPPPPKFHPQKAGAMQAVAIPYGKGRVVVIGEAGMLTAQIDGGERFGMNVAGFDNRQFVLNVMHWLSRVL